MPKKATAQKTVCKSCGVDVRKDTVFCYNCGRALTDDAPVEIQPEANNDDVNEEAQTALDELAERLNADEAADGAKLRRAAAERKKARVVPRKQKEFTWEPRDDSSSRLILLWSLLASAVAALLVFVAVYWK